MKKLLLLTTAIVLMLTACNTDNASNLENEDINTFEVTEATENPDKTNSNTNLTLEERFASIDFYLVSGYYSRNVIQDDLDFMEMFSLEKSNFIRIAENDIEREVFAYNYVSDDFTYMYYFDGELANRTVFNVSTGAILEDEDGFTELLTIEAEELKIYFNTLLEQANLTVADLQIN